MFPLLLSCSAIFKNKHFKIETFYNDINYNYCVINVLQVEAHTLDKKAH